MQWMRSKTLMAGALGISAFVAACTENPPVSAPKSVAVRSFLEDAQQSIGAPRTRDEDFEAIGATTPGFAGFYGDGGNIVVAVTGLANETASAREAVIAYRRASWHAARPLPDRPIVFKQVAYSFGQLANWHRALNRIAPPLGITRSGIDVPTNRLVLGGRDAASLTRLRSWAAAAGVPSAATTLVVDEPARPAQSLTDYVRPTSAGVQIAWYKPGKTHYCTLGANVRPASDTSIHLLVTNSHCGDRTFNSDTSGLWFQNTPPSDSRPRIL